VTGRILCVDFGERRLGVALSDPGATIASPFTTLPRRKGKRPPIMALLDIMKEQDVVEIVVGLPLTLAGDDSEWTRTVREFAATLGARSGRNVILVDERFSSVVAERAVRASGLKKSQREEKERVDAAAAAVILQSYLNTRARHLHGQPDENDGATE
jgi:putative Holliday junction resolvase